MRASIYSLTPPIKYRTNMYFGGAERRVIRKASSCPPSGAYKLETNIKAYMYACPVTRDYVVAARSDTRQVADGRHYACYQTFQQRAAAVMYVHMLGS